MYRGKLAFAGGVTVSLATVILSTYSLAVVPSYVPVIRCHPLVIVPPSAHPNAEAHLDPPELTMNLYLVPVASVPRYRPRSYCVSAIRAQLPWLVTAEFTHADTEKVLP